MVALGDVDQVVLMERCQGIGLPTGINQSQTRTHKTLAKLVDDRVLGLSGIVDKGMQIATAAGRVLACG